MDFTRRTFLAGLGSVTVGLLFSRHLDRVLDDLSRKSTAELSPVPTIPEQLPIAADITVLPQAAFRPERFIIHGTVVGTRMVPVRRYVDCALCDGDGETPEGSCDACLGVGYTDEPTDELREENVLEIPWIVENITIGPHAQFCAAGSVPGDLFSSTAIDSFVAFNSAAPGSEIHVRVRYTGNKPEGEPFRAVLVGSTLGNDGRPQRAMLHVTSDLPITKMHPAII